MLRPLFVTATLSHGGAERHAVALVNRLSARGHECHLAYVKNSSGLQELLRLREGGTMFCLGAARYFDPPALARFAHHLDRIRPSVVVAANPYALMYAWLAVRIARLSAPIAVIYHATRLQGLKEPLQMLLYRLFFWTARCTIFVCESQRRYCLRRGVFSRRNVVIRNGIDTEWFCDRWSPAQKRELRRELGFGDADFLIGMCGLLRQEKNHLQMVQAIAVLRGRGVPAGALLIGDGEMRTAIESRARELGVADHIRITGIRTDVRPCIAACDALALCSTTEALSLAAIEAMAMGRPVVHTDVGGAAELIESGSSGYVVPVGDTAALADSLQTLADGETRRRMGERARRIAKADFSESAMVDRYERVLRQMSHSIRTTRTTQALHSDHGK